MAAHGIVTGHAVGHFPRVHIRVLVIVHQAFHSAVQMEQVGISDLLPSRGRPLRRGSYARRESPHRLPHALQEWPCNG